MFVNQVKTLMEGGGGENICERFKIIIQKMMGEIIVNET